MRLTGLALATIGLAALCLAGCSDAKPKTNADKCAAMGGTYNSAAKTCQFQAGD